MVNQSVIPVGIAVVDLKRFKKVKELYFVEGIIEAYLPLREAGGQVLLRLEALRSRGERDYLVAVYRETQVEFTAPEDDEKGPALHCGRARVWTQYDLIRGVGPDPDGALRQVLAFLEWRCE